MLRLQLGSQAPSLKGELVREEPHAPGRLSWVGSKSQGSVGLARAWGQVSLD